jgi:hypothetical protein
MTTQVSLDTVAAVRAKLESGDLTGVWRALSDAGDVYARATARVTDTSQPTVMRRLVESFWDVDMARSDRFLRRMGFRQTGGNYVLEGLG